MSTIKRVVIPDGHNGLFHSRFDVDDEVRVGSKRGVVIGVGFSDAHVFYDVRFYDGHTRYNIYACDVEPQTLRSVS